MRILGVSGSLRRDSHNRRLLDEAAALLPPEVDFGVYEELKELPPYDQGDDVDGAPAPVQALRRLVADADAILVATPEYNSSLPGQLKNAIDWLSRPPGAGALLGKPVLVMGASTGAFGAVWGQADARKSLARAGARVLDREVPVPYAERRLRASGRLLDDDLRTLVESGLASLLAEVGPPVAVAA